MRRGGMSRALRFLLPKPLTWVKTSSQTILALQGICKWAMLEPCLDWQDMSDTAGKYLRVILLLQDQPIIM